MNWRAVTVGAAIGAVVPFLFLAIFAFSNHGTEAVLLFWPSSLMLMGAEAVPPSGEWSLLVPAVLINVAVYAFLGGALASLRTRRPSP